MMSVKIVSDSEFFSSHTSTLKARQESIPKELLCKDENTFEKDCKLSNLILSNKNKKIKFYKFRCYN